MAPNVPEFLQCLSQQWKDLAQPLLFDGQAHVFNFLQCLGRSKGPPEGHGRFLLHISVPFPFRRPISSRDSENKRKGPEESSSHGALIESHTSRRKNGVARIEQPSTLVQGDLASLDQLSIQVHVNRNEGGPESSKQLPIHEEQAGLRNHQQGNVAHDFVNQSSSTSDLHPLQKQLENLDWISGPVSKEVLGRATWTFLHTLAAQFPEKPTRQQQRDAKELMAILSRLYPCKECADHFKEVLKTNPVQAVSGVELAQWMCIVHNVVNRSLGKPVFPCQRVDARWGALDCDGACDLQGRMH